MTDRREPLPAFDRVVGELAAAARASGASRRTLLRRGLAVPALAAALVAAGATLAATGTLRIGSPVQEPEQPGPNRGDVYSAPVAPATVRLAVARAPDPDGGPPWGVRTFRTTRGTMCAQPGRVVAGRLGLIGFDGAFHELPPRTNLAVCDFPPHPGFPAPYRPPGVVMAAGSLFAPASTVRLDPSGMSTRLGCDQVVRASRAHRPVALTPCDLSRFRYVAWGVLRPGVRTLELTRIPGPRAPARTSAAGDQTFIYALRGGDPQGARLNAVTAAGARLAVARVPRGFTLPHGHPDARAQAISAPRVRPASGGTETTFALSWTVPRSARRRGDGWTYRLFGPGGLGCDVPLATTVGEHAGGIVPKRAVREGNAPLPPSRLLPTNGVRAGERVMRRFRPPGPPPVRWCPGRYTGEIRFRDRIVTGGFGFTVR